MASVPHSGTRSLVKYLDLAEAPAVCVAKGSWIHFGRLDDALNLYPFTHIPIRHPMDVAKSWAQRPKTGDPLGSLIKSYTRMFEWIDANPDLCRFYRMESFPRIAGTDDHKGAPETSGKIDRYEDTVMRLVVQPRRAFFARFYETLAGDE